MRKFFRPSQKSWTLIEIRCCCFLVIANVTNHDLYPSSVLLLHKKGIENINLSRRSCSSRALHRVVFYFFITKLENNTSCQVFNQLFWKNMQEKLEHWFYCADDSIYVSFYASPFIHIGCIGNRIRHQTLERE